MTVREAWIRDDHVTLDKKDDVGRAYGWLRGEHERPPIVLDGKRPYAIINVRRFLEAGGVHAGTNVEKVALPVPVLDEDATDAEVVTRFRDTLAPYLPVGDGKRLAGYVTPLAVLKDLFETGPTAGEAAAPAPVLTHEDTMERAAHAFKDSTVRHLPVMNRGGRLVGALPRSGLVRMQDNADQAMGRKDYAGGRDDFWGEPVLGFMEEGWDEAGEDLRFSDLLARIEEQGTVFVRGRDGIFLGVVDAPLLLRAAAERDERFQTDRPENRPPTPAAWHR